MISRQMFIATAVLFAIVLGLSMYVWKLRQHETSGPHPPAGTNQHLAPPVAGPSEKVTIWVAHDDSGTLRPESVMVPLASGRQQRAEALMRTLLEIYTAKDSSHPLPPGAEIRAVYLMDPGAAVIDVNGILANGQVSGVLAEELTITSFVETLSVNIPGLSRVKILVDGKEGTTLAGHADISNFYDVSQVDELAKQLASQ